MCDSFVIGCVGKPNAGKSSFLNACTDAKAKVGNYPFCTIEPNEGIAHYVVDCPCSTFSVTGSTHILSLIVLCGVCVCVSIALYLEFTHVCRSREVLSCLWEVC